MSYKKKISICTFGIGIKITSSAKVIRQLEANSFFGDYIPGFSFNKNQTNSIEIKINPSYKDNIKVFDTNNTALIRYRDEYSDKDIISLIELILEYYRQKRGIYTIHGSACEYMNQGILIVGGASGIGKSTLAYNLSNKKESGFKFIGDEKISVNDKAEIIGGIQKTGLNKKNNNDDLLIDLNLWQNNATKISVILQPLISEGGKLTIYEWDLTRIRWHMYEEFSRKIRAVSRIVAGFPIQSIDNDELALSRLNFVNSLSSSNAITFFSAQGDINEVSSYVLNIIDRKSHESA